MGAANWGQHIDFLSTIFGEESEIGRACASVFTAVLAVAISSGLG